jgi:peptide/nickel transport system substrate-binding protein
VAEFQVRSSARFLLLSLSFLVFPSLGFGQSSQSKTIVLSVATDPKSFNDIVAQETSTTEITRFLFEGLVRLNTVTGEIEPRLAESWDTSPDGLLWTFHLRRGVTWSDGIPFTSGDVLFTFRDLIYNPAIITAARDIFTLEGKPIHVEAPDEFTVRFTLPSPFAPFLLALGQPILPEHILRETVRAGKFASAWGIDTPAESIVGAGPFRLGKYVPGEKVELVRNERYWQKDKNGERLPHIERIVFLILPSPDMRLLKFLTGELDAYGLAGRDYPLLKEREKQGRFTLYEVGAQPGCNFLAFNQGAKDETHRAWFRDASFRRAVAHALDVDSMIGIVFNGLGIRQCSPLSPATPFYFLGGTPCYGYDPARARELLAGLGFRDRDGDGFLEDAAGGEAEFSLFTNAENPERVEMAGMIREDLARLGLKVHFLPLEFNSLVVRLTATRDWDAILIGLTGEADPHFGANVWRSQGSLHFWSPGSAAGAAEERVDEIFDQAVKTMDRGERKKLYNEWQVITAREALLAFTVLPKVVYAVRDRFENLRPTVLGGPFHNIEEIDVRER